MIDVTSLLNPRNAAIGLYVFLVLIEMIYAARSQRLRYEAKDTATSMIMGLGSTVIGILIGSGFFFTSL